MQTANQLRVGAAIWRRLFDSLEPALSAEAARAILAIKFPQKDIARAQKLAAKARAGELTPDERFEVETYGELDCILGILQSKARMALRKAAPKIKRVKV